MTLMIKGRPIGDGNPCYITFEAGPTHSGVETAKELVRQAAEAGADAVKFQVIDAARLVADRQLPFSYEVLVDRSSGQTETVTEPLYDILKRRTLRKDEWREVKAFADEFNLAFCGTVSFDDEIDFLAELGCDTVKIASADVNHYPLIRRAAETGMCIQLDTGTSSIGEIEAAVDEVLRTGNDRFIIHQCPSGYPARLNSIHLRMIPTLKQMFGQAVAFSDHTPGWEMDVAALALGANMLEKTISQDRTTRSVEHIFSLEGEELPDFVTTIRDVETALGEPRRRLHDDELERRMSVRRSAYVVRSMRAGDVLSVDDLEFRRPGYGIAPSENQRLMGMRLAEDVEEGTQLRWHQLR